MLLTASVAGASLAAQNVTITPQPKVIQLSSSPAAALPAGKTAIVLGPSASEPEHYAAETLQSTIDKRYGVKLPIVGENDSLDAFSALLVIGQAGTSRMVSRLAGQWKMDLKEKAPGLDAYSIRMGEDGGKFVAVVGGSNVRGCIYGQDTLYQLMTKQNGGLALAQASLDDWASVPWRGRPQSSNPLHLIPGRMDSYSLARFNWIDLRNGPGGGQYGYPGGWPLDVDIVKEVVKQAHRRGLIVYATVDCAVRADKFDAVMDTYKQLIALGADALYISIDDPGAEFRMGTPDELLKRVLALGREHGMTGWKIGIVPGKESYKEVLTDVNKRVVKIPGMEDALWYWVMIPSKQVLEQARSIGLKAKPAWWHNWPRPEGGITYGDYGGGHRAEGKPAYKELTSLADGWGKASYDDLAKAGDYIDAVMPWGGGGWGAEYNSCALGWWAWAPELHNWNDVRARVYGIVFGENQVQTAFDFDNAMPALRQLFIAPGRGVSPADNYPPRLKDPMKPEKVHDLADQMQGYLDKLKADAPKQTMISREMLDKYYLEPMQATLDIAHALAKVNYVEYWWPMHENRMMLAARQGNGAQAKAWDQDARKRASAQAQKVRDQLKDLLDGTDEYVKYWSAQAAPVPVVPHVAKGPQLKGDLSDPIWKQAYLIEKFKGNPPDQTEIRLLFTDNDLYIGVTNHEQRMAKLKAVQTQHDSDVWQDDCIELFFNPDLMGEEVYHVTVNSIGTVLDAAEGNAQTMGVNWNPKLQVKAARGADRWTAEIRIPLADLGVTGTLSGSTWSCNFGREDYAGPFSGFEGNNPCEISSWTGGGFHDAQTYLPLSFEQ